MSLPQLPASVKNLAEAIKTARYVPSTTSGSDGICFTKFSFKDGSFLLGLEQEDISETEVIILTDTIAHGWVCWSNNQPTKTLVNFTEALPTQPEPIGEDHYTEGRAIQFKTIDGEVDTIVEGNSYGMRKGVDALVIAIKARAQDPANKNHLYPKVELNSESYKHSSGNTIFNPVFTIIAWCDVNGQEQKKAVTKASKKKVAKKRSRRKS